MFFSVIFNCIPRQMRHFNLYNIDLLFVHMKQKLWLLTVKINWVKYRLSLISWRQEVHDQSKEPLCSWHIGAVEQENASHQ